MNGHPGGKEHTLRMIGLAAPESGSRILDMGAGTGETVGILRSMGFDAVGIDLEPRSDHVERGSFLNLPYPDHSFDAVISQCAFFISGNAEKALSEACRVLRSGGILMLSDVFFEDAQQTVSVSHFRITHHEDMTAQWREYYLEALWNGESFCGIRGKCTYEIFICKKE